ncbi:MAG: primosomal protein, partial [Alphaproteobacteria bacterium]|nr:primosomal protein [Alphaproteobacteria bacterium]
MPRVRVLLLNAALGPLDYRGDAEPGCVVVAPLGPRQELGVAWEAERLPANEIDEARLRPLLQVLDSPPLPA